MPLQTVRSWKALPGVFFVFLLSVLTSCSETANDSTKSGLPAVWSVAPQPQAAIGQLSGEAPYVFSRMGPAVLLPDRRIVVSDNGDAAIRIFHPDGSFDMEFGRRGEGPGEFADIRRIAVVPPDTIIVHDSRRFRLTAFLTSGALLSTLQLQAEGGRPEVYLGELSTGELVFSWIRVEHRDTSQVTPDVMEFGRFDESGRLTEVIGSETGIRRKRSPVAFSPHLHAGLINDSIFLTNGSLPEIQVWDSEGKHVRSIEVPVPVVEESRAWQELEEELRTRNNQMEIRSFETLPREEGIPWIALMLVDDRDRLWVKKYNPRTDSHILFGDRGQGGEWLVMEPHGEVVATIRIPDGFLLLDIRGDQVLGRTVDSLGIQQVQVYDIVGSH